MMKTSASKSNSGLVKATLISSLLGLSMITAGCSDDSAKDDKQAKQEQTEKKDGEKVVAKEKEKAAIPVEVVTVKRSNIQQTYTTITTLEAESDADVVARSTGILQDILVEEGDQVKKGQALAQLDVEQLSLEVAQLEATSNKLRKELKRQEALFNKKLASSDALDRARFEYKAQSAQYQLSKLKLDYATIRAPIDGVITERLVKPGNLIANNQVLFKIVDPASLKAVLHLPEKELQHVKKEQAILLTVDAMRNQVIEGTIERIRPSIDTQTGTFKVVAKLNDKTGLLRSGMFGKVEVVFDVHENSLVLAQETVITQDNRSHVFVVRDNKAIQTPVSIGIKHNGKVEILEGVTESDKVISTGQQILKHESKIEVVAIDDVNVRDQVAKKQTEEKENTPNSDSIASNP
ncbi:efflux RND transporter periplasmic adaptor subunit [Aliikangiella sp. G2MR2-5]|uniref:efflux RND transporter periplasmic adaptor subunit n=1 Tax=Aliikangiella sp. G2MR2-5 TaxID=2788943 RepID=UPI0018AC5E89|nr:efflux RND transporter periplasmic adaptor subunit [Aliikangiella sp. G2MR2-5]